MRSSARKRAALSKSHGSGKRFGESWQCAIIGEEFVKRGEGLQRLCEVF